MRRLIVGLVIVAACSGSGGTAEGFCRRFADLAADIDKGEHVDFAERISTDNLGDPGGTLSDHRDRLETAWQADDSQTVDREFAALGELCL